MITFLYKRLSNSPIFSSHSSSHKPRRKLSGPYGHLENSSLLAIIDKYGVLTREWGGLYYALLEVSMNEIALWRNVRVDDWTGELSIIARNIEVLKVDSCLNKADCLLKGLFLRWTSLCTRHYAVFVISSNLSSPHTELMCGANTQTLQDKQRAYWFTTFYHTNLCKLTSSS